MKKSLIIIFFFHFVFLTIICPYYISAKDDHHKEKHVSVYEPRLSGEVYTFLMRANGSYYLNENWVKGDVLLISGEKAHDKRLKYNTYLDELIWLSSKTYQPVKVDKNLVREFSVNLPGEQEPAIFHNITIDVAFRSEPLNIFAHSLYDGNISLVAHRRVIKTGERLTSEGGTLISVPRLEPDPVFYIVKPDNEAHEVSRFSRRALYRIFPEQRDEIRTALRRERIWIRSENDLIRAVAIIDEVVSQ